MKLDFTKKLNLINILRIQSFSTSSKFVHSANMKPSSALCETEALLVPEDTPRIIAVTVFTFYGAELPDIHSHCSTWRLLTKLTLNREWSQLLADWNLP